MHNKTRDNLIDVLKGLAIVAIVQTHTLNVLPKSGFPLSEFNLSFCVTAFVFAAGWLFRPISDYDSLYKHLGKRIAKLWWLFFAYSIGMLIVSKALIFLGVLSADYNVGTFEALYFALRMNTEQPLLFPMWFVPMFLFASCFFAAAFCFAQQRKNKKLWHCIMAAAFAFAALLAYFKKLRPLYSLDASLLCASLMYAGYFASKHRERLMRCVTWWGTLIAAAFVLCIVFKDGGTIDLSGHYIISPLLFYPVALSALYMALGFSKALSKLPYISDALALCGRNSFHIMALHLLSFKLIDFVWGSIKGIEPAVYQSSPAAFDFWYIYVVLGTALCLAAAELGKKILAFKKSVHQ